MLAGTLCELRGGDGVVLRQFVVHLVEPIGGERR
jgi:hypothetical protein